MALPEPKLGLVVSYSFLWRREHNAGRNEGVKNRPCVIVLAVKKNSDGASTVRVAPVTHSPPANDAAAMEIPQAIKRHLGLDDARSWIILDEVNEFVWPGYDLRPIPPSRDRFTYGFLPPRLFDQMMVKLVQLWRAGTGRSTPRD